MLAYYSCFVVLGYKAAPFGVPSLHLLSYPFGEGEGEKMRWYNPTRRVAESVLAPYTDEEAEDMLRGATDSWAFLMEYERLREEGMGVEQAIVFVGQLFSTRHPRYEPVG
jgi:hypothetical protein